MSALRLAAVLLLLVPLVTAATTQRARVEPEHHLSVCILALLTYQLFNFVGVAYAVVRVLR